MSWQGTAKRFQDAADDFNKGYHKGQADFKASLPSEEEILEVMNRDCGDYYCNFDAESVAKAISERIRDEDKQR